MPKTLASLQVLHSKPYPTLWRKLSGCASRPTLCTQSSCIAPLVDAHVGKAESGAVHYMHLGTHNQSYAEYRGCHEMIQMHVCRKIALASYLVYFIVTTPPGLCGVGAACAHRPETDEQLLVILDQLVLLMTANRHLMAGRMAAR